jgi:hypothetical protein
MATNLRAPLEQSTDHASRRAELRRISAPPRPREVMSYISLLKLLAASCLTLDKTSLQPKGVSKRRRRPEFTVAGTM